MRREELILACCTDLAGRIRGKAFPAADLDLRLKRGIGWTPTNVQITCFDALAETPFGSFGDLVLLPDPAAALRLDCGEDAPAEHVMLGSIHHTDGRPWELCTRAILIAALERLERLAGVTLVGAFEHEFQLRGRSEINDGAYSLRGFRRERALLEAIVAAMRETGLGPETVMKEYGAGQYELTMAPRHGLRIADAAALLRALVCSVAERSGREATFTPIRDPASVGNGVHIHFSLCGAAGAPVTWDPDGPNGLSAVAGSFAAGVLKYLDSFLAITAPSLVSYLRLTPHRWSAAYNNLGERDREAALRLCPVSAMSDLATAEQVHLEFRAADAAASPHLQLAAIVHAGAQGIEEALPAPEASREDLARLDPELLAARGYVRLPRTLAEALDRFALNETVMGWFPAGFAAIYLKHKAAEIAYGAALDTAALCAAYERVY